jgi:hypothetical protein
MNRTLQVNTSGAWKNVLALPGGGDLADIRSAIAMLIPSVAANVAFRVVAPRAGETVKVIASYDSRRGWRGAWGWSGE